MSTSSSSASAAPSAASRGGRTANFIDANVPGSGRWPKKLRYVELRLNAPQYPAGLLGYAVRCVQVVGPPVERGLSVKVREAAGVPKAE